MPQCNIKGPNSVRIEPEESAFGTGFKVTFVCSIGETHEVMRFVNLTAAQPFVRRWITRGTLQLNEVAR